MLDYQRNCKRVNLTNQNTPYKPPCGIALQHRIFAQEALGKKVTPDQPVHHFELGKFKTLIICEDKGYHHLLHLRQRAYEASGDAHKMQCEYCKEYDLPENLKIHLRGRNGPYYHKYCKANYEWRRKHPELCASMPRILNVRHGYNYRKEQEE